MKRIVVSRGIVGPAGMQVCAEKDVTDEEILKACNEENPSGTTNGWTSVIRQVQDNFIYGGEQWLPKVCDHDKDRLHFIVLC